MFFLFAKNGLWDYFSRGRKGVKEVRDKEKPGVVCWGFECYDTNFSTLDLLKICAIDYLSLGKK